MRDQKVSHISSLTYQSLLSLVSSLPLNYLTPRISSRLTSLSPSLIGDALLMHLSNGMHIMYEEFERVELCQSSWVSSRSKCTKMHM